MVMSKRGLTRLAPPKKSEIYDPVVLLPCTPVVEEETAAAVRDLSVIVRQHTVPHTRRTRPDKPRA